MDPFFAMILQFMLILAFIGALKILLSVFFLSIRFVVFCMTIFVLFAIVFKLIAYGISLL